jgi:CRISPR-associated endoribonuclease Cas6
LTLPQVLKNARQYFQSPISMRLYLSTSSSKQLFSYNYQNRLTGAIHKWLGADNPYHGKPALYSFSALNGGHSVENQGLRFPDGARWFISAFEPEFIKRLILGIQRDPLIMEDMTVRDVMIQEDPAFGAARVFKVGSPVLVKQKLPEGRTHHCIFSEAAADKLLTMTLRTKLMKAGLPTDGVRVEFRRDHPGARVKVIHYDGIGNRANFCPVAISGSPEQLAFAWNVGIGNSTGIGFGSLV